MQICFLYFILIPSIAFAEPLISEVAPSIPNGDFVEIFSPSPSNLKGWELQEGGKVIKKFPDVTLNRGAFGSYLLIHASEKVSENAMDETDLTGDINGNGMIDLYSDESSPGVTGGASNNITLKSESGRVIDFLSWITESDPYSSAIQAPYVQASSASIWNPACAMGQVSCFQSGSFPWMNKSSFSISRKMEADGLPRHSKPSSNFNWQITLPTPGQGYYKTIEPKESLLEIFQSPFSPLDGPFREALISFQTLAQSQVTISIYNLQGNLMHTLLEMFTSPSNDIQVIPWDGKDKNGEIVPVGIYLVRIRVIEPDKRGIDEMKPVVVARNL